MLRLMSSDGLTMDLIFNLLSWLFKITNQRSGFLFMASDLIRSDRDNWIGGRMDI